MNKQDLDRIKKQLKSKEQVITEWSQKVVEERREAEADPEKMKTWIENEKSEFEQAIAIQKKIIANLKMVMDRPEQAKMKEGNQKRLKVSLEVLAKMEQEYEEFQRQYL